MLYTPICDLCGIRYPIFLAGMGGLWGQVVPPALVAAVSNAGGLGVTGLTDVEPEEIRRRIRAIRELTDKPFGIDLLLPASMDEAEPESIDELWARIQREHPEHVAFVRKTMAEFGLAPAPPARNWFLSPRVIRAQVQAVLEEKVPLFAAALGDPGWVVPRAHAIGTKVLGLAGSARNASRQKKAGVDLVVAQGGEAGGHTGTVTTMVLVPEVVDAVAPTPVLAAGGIVDGRSIAAALALGAQGVWIGTAFLLSEESGIDPVHKRDIAAAASEDFIVTRAYTGKTARDVRNAFIDRWETSGLKALPMPLQWVLLREFRAAAQAANRLDLINNPAGQGGGRLKEIRPARAIFERLVRETEEAVERLAAARRA
jgi:NAD(P)H-dependent flavin oxidoreductase YrpB (nitropropane dioxygenase family)